jgi:hypothetical protein
MKMDAAGHACKITTATMTRCRHAAQVPQTRSQHTNSPIALRQEMIKILYLFLQKQKLCWSQAAPIAFGPA